MISQAVDICVTFPGKYPWIPDRYLQKRIHEREMFQDWTASSPPNIFPHILMVCCAMQETVDLGAMSSIKMGLAVLLQNSLGIICPFSIEM